MLYSIGILVVNDTAIAKWISHFMLALATVYHSHCKQGVEVYVVLTCMHGEQFTVVGLNLMPALTKSICN